MDDSQLKATLYQLVVAQLQADGFHSAASSVAQATSSLPIAPLGKPGLRLADLVKKSLQTEFGDTGYGNELTKSLDLDDKSSRGNLININECRHAVIHNSPIRAVRFSPDGEYIATGTVDGKARIIQTQKFKQLSQRIGGWIDDATSSASGLHDSGAVVRLYPEHSQVINDLVFHPSLPLLITGSRDGSVRIFNYSSPEMKKPVHTYGDTFAARSIGIHPSGRMLVAATDDPALRIYDLQTSKCYSVATNTDNHLSPVNDLNFSVDGRVMVTAGMDGSIRLWDALQLKAVGLIPSAHGGADVTSVQITKNNRYLLSSGKDGQTRLWDLSTSRNVKMFNMAMAPKTSSRLISTFSFNEQAVVVVDETGLGVNVQDSVTTILSQKLSGHGGPVRALCASPVDFSVATGSDDGKLRLWVPPF